MTVIKKFTAIMIGTETINDTVMASLSFGDITGPYYDRERPNQEFDTEQEATEYAYQENKWATWLIVPIIKFETE